MRRTSVTNIFPGLLIPERHKENVPESPSADKHHHQPFPKSDLRRISTSVAPLDQQQIAAADARKLRRCTSVVNAPNLSFLSLPDKSHHHQPSPKPGLRRISTAVAPLDQQQIAAADAKIKMRRCSSVVNAPNLSSLSLPGKSHGPLQAKCPASTYQSATQAKNYGRPFDGGSGSAGPQSKMSRVLSKCQLEEMLREIQDGEYQIKHHLDKEEKPRETNKQIQQSFKDSYKKDATLKMTLKTTDSTLSSDEIVLEWKEKWSRKTGSGQGEVKGIKGICFMENGKVAVVEDKNARVQIFDKKTGDSFGILQEDAPMRKMKPGGICEMPQRRFLAVTDLRRVIYFDPSVNRNWSTSIELDDHLHLHGIATTTDGDLILTDLDKKTAHCYDTGGKKILQFQTPTDLSFAQPNAVAVNDEYGIVFVSDSERGCVFMFSQNGGEFLNRIGKHGEDSLIYPSGITCLVNGKVVVADRAEHRLVTYDIRSRSYEHLSTQKDHQFHNPSCLSSDGRKYLAVSEENHDFKIDEYKLKMFTKYSSKRNQLHDAV